MPTQLLRKLPQQSKVCEIAPLRQYRYSATTGTKLRDNYNILQKQSQVGFSPGKLALGFLGGAVGSKGMQVMAKKYAIMRKMNAKNNDKKLYDTLKLIDTSPKFGSKMNLIGLENLNSDVLAYALANNKRIAINKLDENIAKGLGFKYPNDVRRTIQPDEIYHTLKRHGENSLLVRKSGQKPITLEEIAKYQEYTKDSENILSIDNSKSLVLVSFKQINGFFVVVEQVKRKANELGFKTMYFEKGDYRQSNIYKETKSSSNAIHWL